MAEAVNPAHAKIEFRDWVPLSAAQRELVLAVRKPNSEQLAYIRRVLASPRAPSRIIPSNACTPSGR